MKIRRSSNPEPIFRSLLVIEMKDEIEFVRISFYQNVIRFQSGCKQTLYELKPIEMKKKMSKQIGKR